MPFVSDLPAIITAGTTIKWIDEAAIAGVNETISSPDWTLKYYLRTNTNSQGHTATGSQFQNTTGWEFTITASDSTNFIKGNWIWQAIASKSSENYLLGEGEFIVKESLVYSGTPGAIDNRTQVEIDYDLVTAAIRTLSTDLAAEYSIGNRKFKRVDLAELRMLQSELAGRKFSEKRLSLIKQGLGDPKNLFIRF
tara:strand:- start:1462 stop:2046 length:585 start_codon:yes stop_codon:yes gene_type:complete